MTDDNRTTGQRAPEWRYAVDHLSRHETRHKAIGIAARINGRRPVAEPASRELGINGETVLEVYQPFEEDELLAAVAAILTCYSNGEDYDEIVRVMEFVDPENDQTLDEWL